MAIFPILVIARWLHFTSVSVLFGSTLFWFYTCAGPSKAQSASPRAFAATHRLLCVAAPVAAVSGLVWLVAMLAAMTSDDGAFDWSAIADPETLRRFFFETGFGAVWSGRLALLAAALYSVARLPPVAAFRALVPLGAALLVSQAWLGHAAQGTGAAGAAMTAAYGVHVLAAAAWVGGLAPLLFVLARLRTAADGRPEILKTLSRFSAMGMVAVAAIVVSGAGNVRFHAGGEPLGRLFETEYGGILGVKLALFGLMLALAVFNRVVAMARLRGAASGPAGAALYAAVALELALGVLVLGAAALLGLTPPP
jgi:putative copper resistance protein D